MPRLADTIDLSAAEHRYLERLKRAASTPQSLACRVRMILLAGDGVNVVETAERLGVWRKTVSRWRGPLARQFWIVGLGRGALERCPPLRRAGADHARGDLRDRGAGLRATLRERAPDKPLEPAGAGRRGDETRHRGKGIATLGGALFKKNLTSSRIVSASG